MEHHNQDNITPAALLEQLVYVDTFMPDIDDPSTLDERLTAELSAFADDSFVFPDEEKPQNNGNSSNDDHKDNNSELLDRFNQINNNFGHQVSRTSDVKQFNTLQSSSFTTGISNVLSPLSSLQSSNHQRQQLQQQQQQQQQQHHQSLSQPNSNEDSKDLLSNLPKVAVPPGAQSSLIAAGLSQTQIDALAALVAQHQGVDAPSSGDSLTGDTLQNGLNSFANDEFLGNHPSVNPTITTSNDDIVTPTSSGNTPMSFQQYQGSDRDSRRASIKIESSGDVDLDKRRRNTAASARFRIKKKLKEQQLERSVRELNELTMTLEKKIQTLEMENKLLRNLVVEKGEQRNNEDLENLKKRVRSETANNNIQGNQLNNNYGGETTTF